MIFNFLNYITDDNIIPLNFLNNSPKQPIDTAKLQIQNYVKEMVADPDMFFNQLFSSAIDFGIKLICAILIYIIGAIIIKAIKKYLKKIFKARKTEPTIASFTLSITTITLTLLLIILTISTLGINTTSFAALLAAGGMAIGMALSGTLQNFAGGVMILFFRPFKAGDHIISQNYEGFVLEVNIVSTKIRTFDNAIVIMPNGTLFNNNITNISGSNIRRVKWYVTVAYGSNASVVKKAILDMINKDKRILHPVTNSSKAIIEEPAVSLSAMKDSSIEFYARAWCTYKDYWDVFFDINEKIYTELPQLGIEFPFPQMDVHIKREDNNKD